MEGTYFNRFANTCKEKNYKLNSNTDRFADDMDMDKFEQLRMDYWKMNSDTPINCFVDYMWAALEAMEWFGLYLWDDVYSQHWSEHQIVIEFCEENQWVENSSVTQNVGDDPPTTPTCLGCVENQPNQLAHMGHGGCLHNADDDDLSDDEEAAPDVLVVSISRRSSCKRYAGKYIKNTIIVRGAPLYVKTNSRGAKFFLFRNDVGNWSFSDSEQDIETCMAAISSISTTASLPCEPGIKYETVSDADAINDNDVWAVDESIVVRVGQV